MGTKKRTMIYKVLLSLCWVLLLLSSCNREKEVSSADSKSRPNIIVILADDMGYSDIGSFGSEIQTPNLDRLAKEGLRMTQFYNAARCCPSRASLLTGVYPHQAGIGGMTDQEVDISSYQGYFNDHVVTLADVLGEAGYRTYTSGKWHVGDEPEHRPLRHGFDRCFSFIHGASSYFDMLPYRNSDWPWSDGQLTWVEDSTVLTPPDTLFYSTDLYTEKALGFISEAVEADAPFFLYLAYNAPHWPLHALPEDIRKYEGMYEAGWDKIRNDRYERQKQMNLIPNVGGLSETPEEVEPWLTVEDTQKESYIDLMKVYAAMVDRMDQNIGRVIKLLQKRGVADNTLILFLSDNGGCRADFIPYKHERLSESAPVGTPKSFVGYGPQWANLSNVPFRRYKAETYEGGIATPFVAWYPKAIPAGNLNHTPAHIIDIMPTLIDFAQTSYPSQFDGNEIVSLPGKSLHSIFMGDTDTTARPLFFEHYGHKAVRYGRWKLVAPRGEDWELYDMANDRSERFNKVEEYPLMADDLIELYQEWAANVGAYEVEYVNSKTKKIKE